MGQTQGNCRYWSEERAFTWQGSTLNSELRDRTYTSLLKSDHWLLLKKEAEVRSLNSFLDSYGFIRFLDRSMWWTKSCWRKSGRTWQVFSFSKSFDERCISEMIYSFYIFWDRRINVIGRFFNFEIFGNVLVTNWELPQHRKNNYVNPSIPKDI